jgi:hypothetical protein
LLSAASAKVTSITDAPEAVTHTQLSPPHYHRNAPDPHGKRNQTLGLVLTQAFFDDIQHNLVVPAILNLESVLNTSFIAPWSLNL